jgi:16S rRNA (adenine1518-N6/adenine1519-N6)-dimethyltransferase
MNVRALLREYDIRPSKGLGQHFMVDRRALERIVEAAELGSEDTILEIGPGLGTLTQALAERAGRVIAVELDERMVEILSQTLADRPNVEIMRGDILELDPAELVEGARYKVVANLPYYITSAVLRHFLEVSVKPSLMVVMVQKEVAMAIVAGPGKSSLLSISVQFYGRPKFISKVPAQSFYPAPEVDSAILRIDLYPKPAVAVDDVEGFFEMVRAGFASPRKQLANSLSYGLEMSKADVLNILEEASIAPQRRAETLNLEEWARLRQAYKKCRREKAAC